MKKEWTTPELTCLNVQETKLGYPDGTGDKYVVTPGGLDEQDTAFS